MTSLSLIQRTCMQSFSQPLEIKPANPGEPLNWVIVGGGPAGLLTALLLSKKKVGKITIIEPRIGEYVRSGDYVNEVFIELSEALDIPLLEILPSYANHIKDVERKLYERVKALGTIEIIQGKFTTYSQQGVHVACNDTNESKNAHKDEDQKKSKSVTIKERIIPCNVLMDCSGQNLSVVNEANKLHSPTPIFTRKTIGKSPHTHHIHATILMDRKKADEWRITEPLDGNLINKAKAKEALRNLGWHHWANPFGYINSFGSFNLVKSEKMQTPLGKYHFYSEVPADLKENEVIPWIKAYIAATSGAPLDSIQVTLTHKSNKHPYKKQCDIFEAEPRFTTPFHYVDHTRNSMVVVPLGDAAFNNLFYFGRGIRRAISQISTFVNNIQVNDNGTVAIDFPKFETWSKTDLQLNMRAIEEVYKHRYIALTTGEQDQNDTASELYNDGLIYLNLYANDQNNATFDRLGIINIALMIDLNFESLVLAWKSMPTNQSKKDIENALLRMAKHCKQFADYLNQKNEPIKALKYYNKALEIYSNYLPTHEHSNEIAIINSTIKLKIFPLIKTQIKTLLEEDYDPGLFGPISYFPDTLSAGLIKLAQENNEAAYKKLILKLFKEDKISLSCAIQLNQLMVNNSKFIKVSDLHNEIVTYNNTKGAWKKFFGTSTQTIRDYTLLHDIALKNKWSSIDKSHIELCLQARAKRDFSSITRSGSSLKRDSIGFFNAANDSQLDSLSKTETFLRNIKAKML